tara:strand:- start:239 stop:394 length:156 start_codon:yes stop_codon:yes gene_type:complete
MNVLAEMEDIVAQSIFHQRILLAQHNARYEWYAEELLDMLCCELGKNSRIL